MDATPDIQAIIQSQRLFFKSGQTLAFDYRIQQLQKLKKIVIANEDKIAEALYNDLHKSKAESVMTEIMLVIDEIDFACRRLKKWMKPVKVRTPFPALSPGTSHILHEPYGCVLIMSPWNYPFLLIMSPLIGAIAAGNCVLIKPSEIATHTQQLLLSLINEHFSSNFLFAHSANAEQTDALLKEQFDYIFFTGGLQIGKLVMQAAANYATPLTLELGGKSPCIVDATADLDFAARRIVWAKITNASQTCIAPDFLYIEKSCKDIFIKKMQIALRQFCGENAASNPDYPKIINQKQFARLNGLLKQGRIICGGNTNADTLYIEPTLIDNVSWQDTIMQQEIFGPLLPIMTFDTIEEVVQQLQSMPKPLALYYFTSNKNHERQILQHVSFGGGCINDCMMHIVNIHLPFGGVGASGIGSYHGRYSFETFSHRKSIYKKLFSFDMKLEYPPFSNLKLKWLRRLFSWSF